MIKSSSDLPFPGVLALFANGSSGLLELLQPIKTITNKGKILKRVIEIEDFIKFK
jgi:hypothetical protein